VSGRGIALGTHIVSYGSAVADVGVDRESGEIRIKHLYGALDAGLVVNPALVANQIVGMPIQATNHAARGSSIHEFAESGAGQDQASNGKVLELMDALLERQVFSWQAAGSGNRRVSLPL
jgi:hypothetical protein